MPPTLNEVLQSHYRDNLQHLVSIAQDTLKLISVNPYYQKVWENLDDDVTLGDCNQFLNSLSAELDSDS